MRDNAVEKLFSLFTSSDRAVAMAGDLAEEREMHGSFWFWSHVLRVTLTLRRNAAMEAPLRVLALVLAGLALLTPPALGGVATVYLFPTWTHSPVSWIAPSFFWCVGALCTGASLVAFAPRHGVTACATLAVVGEALLITFGGPPVYALGLLTAIALLTGAAMTRRERHP